MVKYSFTSPEEAPERVTDADVIVVNKVQINRRTIGTAQKLKLVCVTATGTNSLDKEYLASRKIAWRNVVSYSTESVAQHTFALLFYLMKNLRYTMIIPGKGVILMTGFSLTLKRIFTN